MTICKNLCRTMYEGSKDNGGGGKGTTYRKSKYAQGFRYCSYCEVFVKGFSEKMHCLCCGKKLRVKAANGKTNRNNRDELNIVRY